MTFFHLHLKIITRGEGKSAVAAAAYRSGETLKNEYDGIVHDYTRKGGVVRTEILLPKNAPHEFSDRNTLWNAVEKIEKQRNAQLAREVEISLPAELTLEQNILLVRQFVQDTFVDNGMCADICIHDPKRDTPNPHAHIMLTMRPFNEDKTWGAKIKKVNKKPVYTTDWNERDKAEQWRAAWANAINAALTRNGFAETVDHRSYARQGIDKIPTIHLGVAATQMERRGIETDRGNINREIDVTNSQLRQLRARVSKVQVWLDGNKANTPPTLAEVLKSILAHDENKTHSKQIADLKLASNTLVFIVNNNIADLPALADKVSAIRRGCNDAYNRKKKTERRIKTLDKHLEQSEIFKKHRSVKAEYDKLLSEAEIAANATGLFAKSKADKTKGAANDFYESHRAELTLYAAAEKYLRDCLQKRFDPAALPVKMWRDEHEMCKRELAGINAEYAALKNDVENAEAIKRFAVKLMLPDDKETRDRRKILNREETL